MLKWMRSLLNPASSIYFYGLLVNGATILFIRFADPVYGPKVEWPAFGFFVVYYTFITIWLSHRLMRGTRSLESWFDLVLVASIPVGVYYGYLSYCAPPYAPVFWIWGTTVGMPGFGYIRTRYWLIWVVIMFAATLPGFLAGDFEIRIVLSMVWFIILTYYMARASNQLKKSRQALSVQLTKTRRNKRELEKAHQKLRAASDRFQVELELAERLQQGLLPSLSVPGNRLILRGRYLAMQNLGGDFYDMAAVNGRTIVLIADVTGHGVAAALITTMTKAAFHSHKSRKDAGEILAAMNRDLCDFLSGGQHFVTAFCAVFEPGKGTVTYANAGHPPPLRLSEGRLTELGDESLLLGVRSNASWQTHSIDAKPEDRFFFYTDGLTEAFSDDKSMYAERLHDQLIRHASLDAEDFLTVLLEDLKAFRGSAPQSDDIAVLCVDIPK
jgi:sigma-B regulation protein RsbU (phosphoserine phosphatase)